jgi:hypothetical protein
MADGYNILFIALKFMKLVEVIEFHIRDVYT